MVRPSYEASVILIGLDDTSESTVRTLRSMGMAGIATAVLSQGATEGLQPGVRPPRFDVVLSDAAGESPTPVDAPTLADMARHYDVVVFASSSGEPPRQELSVQLLEALENEGPLVGGLVIRNEGEYSPELMAVLRASVHMLVSVRSLHLAFEFMDALRGGAYR